MFHKKLIIFRAKTPCSFATGSDKRICLIQIIAKVAPRDRKELLALFDIFGSNFVRFAFDKTHRIAAH